MHLKETVWKKEDSTFSQRDAFAMTPAARGPVVGGCRPRYPSHDWEILRVTGDLEANIAPMANIGKATHRNNTADVIEILFSRLHSC